MISIVFAESSFIYSKVSASGDYGLGQIQHYIWKDFFNATKDDLLNPILAIKYSCEILKMAQIAHPDDPQYWSYYHSRKDIPRIKYINKINKILKQIQE